MSSQMHTQIYADERARQMGVAAAERQIGCSFGRMISEVIMKCNGRGGRMRSERLDYGRAMAYPPAQTHYARPTASTVTYTAATSHHANAHATPAEPPQFHAPVPCTPFPPAAGPPRAGGKKPRKRKKSKHARFSPAGPVPLGPAPPPPQHAEHEHQHAAPGTTGGDHQQHHYSAVSEPYYPPPAYGQGYGYGYARYPPSPLTRWEMLGAAGTPRRHEYLSGEYRWCYPTPVREGICSVASDPNRLTAMFSEENPNACTIV